MHMSYDRTVLGVNYRTVRTLFIVTPAWEFSNVPVDFFNFECFSIEFLVCSIAPSRDSCQKAVCLRTQQGDLGAVWVEPSSCDLPFGHCGCAIDYIFNFEGVLMLVV